MKIGVTINLGNYESIRVDTGEHTKYSTCIKELIRILQRIPHDKVKFFYSALYKQDLPDKPPDLLFEEGIETHDPK